MGGLIWLTPATITGRSRNTLMAFLT